MLASILRLPLFCGFERESATRKLFVIAATCHRPRVRHRTNKNRRGRMGWVSFSTSSCNTPTSSDSQPKNLTSTSFPWKPKKRPWVLRLRVASLVFRSPGYFPGDTLKTRSFRCFKCMNQKAGVACKRQSEHQKLGVVLGGNNSKQVFWFGPAIVEICTLF